MSDARSGGLPRVGFAILAFAFGLNAIIPLFPRYAEAFALSSGDLTLAFATYALVLLPTLLLTGHVSDAVGRKRVLLPALVLAVLGSLAFAFARGLPGLVAGRAVQGLAGGAFWGTIAAYARDLTSDVRRDRASLLVTVMFTAGLATGAVISGLVVELTDVLAAPWLIHCALLAGAIVAVASGRETVPARRRPDLHVRMRLPAGHETAFKTFLVPIAFVLVAVSVVVLSLTPLLLDELRPVRVAVMAGIALAAQLTLATIAQLATARIAPIRLMAVGTTTITAGVTGLVVAATTGSMVAFALGLALVGASTGVILRSTFTLAERMGAAEERGAVLSAYNVVLYGGLSVPALVAGYLADSIGIAATLASVGAIGVVVAAFAFLRGLPTVAAEVRTVPVLGRGDGSEHGLEAGVG